MLHFPREARLELVADEPVVTSLDFLLEGESRIAGDAPRGETLAEGQHAADGGAHHDDG